MALGCRVVRGPDWKWGDQDGGEGGVGTIVDLHNFADGRKLPSKTVLVCWDCGNQADYRTGRDGCHDLRVFDSSSAGVEFRKFTCDGCMHSGITGIRWHCTECNDYDLCNVCYLNGVHEKNHAFMRFHISNDKTNGTNVGKRSDAEKNKIRSRGMFPGALVKQGRDWTMDNELGSKVGKVVGITEWENVPRSAVLVNWENSAKEVKHRVGYEGKMDLELVQAENGPFYYKDHLPVVSTTDLPRTAFTGGTQLQKGDFVKTELDVETLKEMAEGHGGWVDDMEKVIGQVGRVLLIDEDGDVHVRYGATKWVFHPVALCKAKDFRTGDKVKLTSNKETLENLQHGHGGWNNAMGKALGKVGKVIKVDEDGDLMVSIEGNVWLFNPNALSLESKEEERRPAGQDDPSDSSTTASELLLHAMLEGVSKAGSGSETGIVEKTLVLATTLGDLDKVKQIIGRNKALVNHKIDSNHTPLQVACHQGKSEIVSYLLENGADKELRDGEGYTALHHAAYGDETGVCVVVLLSANAQVNPDDLDRTKVTPLHLAVQRGNEKAVAALVQSENCDLNCQDVFGDTPLHEAILRGHDNIFTYLLKAQNVDPTICNANGFNILHLASLKNRQHAAELLIEKFPELVDIVKEDGFSALHVAAINNHHEIAKQLILSGHSTINMQNQDGMTPLALAVSSSQKEVIELLVEHEADVNMENKHGDTPLHVAVMKHCIEYANLESVGLKQPADVTTEKAIALFLVTRGGARTDYKNHQGKTPLDLCIDEELKGMLLRLDKARRKGQPKQQGETQDDLAAGPPLPDSSQSPSPRTGSRQSTSPSVTDKPILPSSPPTQQGETQDDLAAGPPLPDSSQAPSPRTDGPQSVSPVTDKPILPSFSPTQQGETQDDLAAGPPLPDSSQAPSPRTDGPQSASPSVTDKSILSSSSPTQQGETQDDLAEGPPLPDFSQTPSPRTGSPQSTSPSVADKPILSSSPPTQQGETQDDLAAGTPMPDSSQAPSPRIGPPIDTRASAVSEASSMALGPGSSASHNAEASPTGDIPMELVHFNVRNDTPASNVDGACSAEPERRNPNIDIESEIQPSSIENIKKGEMCHFCGEEEAVVIFKPCNHKVLCRFCAERARFCMECKKKITKKNVQGTNNPLSSLSDYKQDYEKRIAELDRLANCQICMEDRPSNVVFRPCGHRSCSTCAKILCKCHSCYVIIEERITCFQ